MAGWLHSKLASLVQTLTGAGWLHSPRAKSRVLSLRTIVHFVAHGPAVPSATDAGMLRPTFDKQHLDCLVQGLTQPPTLQPAPASSVHQWLPAGDVLDALVEEFADEYDDFRLQLLQAVQRAAVEASQKPSSTSEHESGDVQTTAVCLHELLSRVSVPPSEAAWGPRSFIVPPDVTADAEASGADGKGESGDDSAAGAEEEEDAAYVAVHGSSGAGLAAAAAQFSRRGRKAQRKRKRESLKAVTGGVVAASAGSLTSQHRSFQDAWLAVLRLPLPRATLKRVLSSLEGDILPTVVNPLLFADFLSAAYSTGGVIALLSLEALWHLMSHHGLEYPSFYAKLYALLTQGNLVARYNGRFMALLDMFLSSAALPAYLVAAFAKRLARLAVRGPPTVACLALPLMYNALKRHPACTPLLHRAMPKIGRVPQLSKSLPGAAEAVAGSGVPPLSIAGGVWEDPFHEEADDPAKANALASQLWEIVALQSHWSPQVARLAELFGQAMTRKEFNVSQATANTFSTLMKGALRPVAAAPASHSARGRPGRKHDRRRKRVSGEAALSALSATPLAIHTQDSVGDAVRDVALVTGAGDDGWEGNPYFLKPITAGEDEEEGARDGEILAPPTLPDSDGEPEPEEEGSTPTKTGDGLAMPGGAHGVPFGAATIGSLEAMSLAVGLGTRSVNLLPHILDFGS